MNRNLGRSSKQVLGINADLLDRLFLANEDSIRGIQDRALLLVAYDTVRRCCKLVSLKAKHVKINIKNDSETASILLKKVKSIKIPRKNGCI